MVANTGTYLDTPFHRFAGGADLAAIPLGKVADLPGLVVRVNDSRDRAIDRKGEFQLRLHPFIAHRPSKRSPQGNGFGSLGPE